MLYPCRFRRLQCIDISRLLRPAALDELLRLALKQCLWSKIRDSAAWAALPKGTPLVPSPERRVLNAKRFEASEEKF